MDYTNGYSNYDNEYINLEIYKIAEMFKLIFMNMQLKITVITENR